MNLQEAIYKAGQILDEERVAPTVHYEAVPNSSVLGSAAALFSSLSERGKDPLPVRENPEAFQFESGNFDLLCALLDQVPEQDRPKLFSYLGSSILNAGSYRHKYVDLVTAGFCAYCSSELPLLAEFLVRRGDRKLFIHTLSEAAPSPGLTLLLMQMKRMIAFNFTLFTDEEYAHLPGAITNVRHAIADLQRRPKRGTTEDSNTIYHVCGEVPDLCDSLTEECRKARFLYFKGLIVAGNEHGDQSRQKQGPHILGKVRFSAIAH